MALHVAAYSKNVEWRADAASAQTCSVPRLAPLEAAIPPALKCYEPVFAGFLNLILTLIDHYFFHYSLRKSTPNCRELWCEISMNNQISVNK